MEPVVRARVVLFLFVSDLRRAPTLSAIVTECCGVISQVRGPLAAAALIQGGHWSEIVLWEEG